MFCILNRNIHWKSGSDSMEMQTNEENYPELPCSSSPQNRTQNSKHSCLKSSSIPVFNLFLAVKIWKGFTDIMMIIRNTSAGQTWAKSIILTLAELLRFSSKLKINQKCVMTLHFLLRIIRIALGGNIVYKWQVDGPYFWRAIFNLICLSALKLVQN